MTSPRDPQIAQPAHTLVANLRDQIDLLANHYRSAFIAREKHYVLEVANKLRLLTVKAGRNRPLLFAVAEQVGYEMRVTLGGPPGVGFGPGTRGGDVVTFADYMELLAIAVGTSNGLVSMSRKDIVRGVCEKLGGAHSDTGIGEALAAITGADVAALKIGVGDLSAAEEELKCLAELTIRNGTRVAIVASKTGEEETAYWRERLSQGVNDHEILARRIRARIGVSPHVQWWSHGREGQIIDAVALDTDGIPFMVADPDGAAWAALRSTKDKVSYNYHFLPPMSTFLGGRSE